MWGYGSEDDIETIRGHIRFLHRWLETDPLKPKYIKTVYGALYCMNLPYQT